MQISTLDGVSKRIRLTSEMTGQELVALFASKIGMTDTAFFQLSAVTDGCGKASTFPFSHPFFFPLFLMILARLLDKWVAYKESVLGQGINQGTPLTLKLRFFWQNPVEIKDPITKALYYVQVS